MSKDHATVKYESRDKGEKIKVKEERRRRRRLPLYITNKLTGV